MGGATTALGGSSGRIAKGALLRVRFFQYTEVRYPNLGFDPPPQPDSIYPLEAGTLHVPVYGGSEPVKEQWVYLFSLKHSRSSAGQYVSLTEMWTDASGKISLVPWGPSTRDAYSQMDERPKGAAKSAVQVEWSELYACLTRFPLSAERLRQYLRSPDLVKRRCERIVLDDLSPDPSLRRTYRITLLNHERVLGTLREHYHDALEEYGTHLADEKKANERLLVSLTLSAAASYVKARGWTTEAHLTEIDLRKARYDQWLLHKDLLVAQKKREWWAGRLAQGLEATTFREMRNDWWAASEDSRTAWVELEGKLSEELYQSDAGRRYVQWAIADPENLFEKLLKSHDETGIRAFKIARKGTQALNGARAVLINFAILKVGSAKTIREAYQFFLPNTFKILDIPLDEIGMEFVRDRKTVRGTLNNIDKLLFDLEYGRLKSVELSARAEKMMPNMVLFVHMLNLAYEMRALQGKKAGVQTYGQIVAIGAATTATVASLKSILGSESRLLTRLAGVLDAASQIVYGYDAAKSGKDIRAIAYGITAGASLMMIMGFTTVVGVMGLILYVMGQVLLALFTNTPLEDFFERCKWGRRFPGESRYPASEQLKELMVTIGEPKVDVQVSKEDGRTRTARRSEAKYISLVISPSIFFVNETEFKIQLKLSEFVATLMETVDVPMQEDILIFDKDGDVHQIIKNWEIAKTDFQLIDNNFQLEYAIRPKFLSSWGQFSAKGYGGQKYVDLGLQ